MHAFITCTVTNSFSFYCALRPIMQARCGTGTPPPVEFSPDGASVLVASGNRLLVYDVVDGSVVSDREAHTGAITAVAVSPDGGFVASGSEDGSVSVWTWELNHKFTFNHTAVVTAVAFNPIQASAAPLLTSCSAAGDFALWTMPSTSLRKMRLPDANDHITSAHWSADGAVLALGLASGSVSLRDLDGAELALVPPQHQQPEAPPVDGPLHRSGRGNSLSVVDVAWVPSQAAAGRGGGGVHSGDVGKAAGWAAHDERGDSNGVAPNECLAVAHADGTLSFFSGVDCSLLGAPRQLGFKPSSLRAVSFSGAPFLLAGMAGSKDELIAAAGGSQASKLPVAFLLTREGVRLAPILAPMPVAQDGTPTHADGAMAWRAVPRPPAHTGAKSSVLLAVTGLDGSMSLLTLSLTTVHGLYRELYACRDNAAGMTDVLVQDLLSSQRCRIRCRGFVKKIAVHRDVLAIQLPQRIVVFRRQGGGSEGAAGGAVTGGLSPARQSWGDEHDAQSRFEGGQSHAETTGGSNFGGSTEPQQPLRYTARHRIATTLDCSLLVATAQHVIQCVDRRLLAYDCASGEHFREWALESPVRYIRVLGGLPGSEGLLVGLKGGGVFAVFVDNPLPQLLVRHPSPIRCLDVSLSRRKLAVVDEASVVTVYDIPPAHAGPTLDEGQPRDVHPPIPPHFTPAVLFTEEGATSVSWNSESEDMLCFSGAGQLAIKVGRHPTHRQRLAGFVVGFVGARVFLLQSTAMQTVGVALSDPLRRYIASQAWTDAYQLACLGVSDSDWRLLGEAALRTSPMQLSIARSVFQRLQDPRKLELVAKLEREASKPASYTSPQSHALALHAEVLAHAGDVLGAAKLLVKAGLPLRALAILIEMRMWDPALALATERCGGADSPAQVSVIEAMLSEAGQLEAERAVQQAAALCFRAGEARRAVDILVAADDAPALQELVEALPAPPQDVTADSAATAAISDDLASALSTAAAYFARRNAAEPAIGALRKLGPAGVAQLLDLFVRLDRWQAAEELANRLDRQAQLRGELGAAPAGDGAVSTLLGDRLRMMQALREAQRAAIAVEAGYFNEASRRYIRCGLQALALAHAGASPYTGRAQPDEEQALLELHSRCACLGELYEAYSVVTASLAAAIPPRHGRALSPAPPPEPRTVHHACRFLLAVLTQSQRGSSTDSVHIHTLPSGVSLVPILAALATASVDVGCMRSARFAASALKGLRVPSELRVIADRAALEAAARPADDAEETVCYRCGVVNPVSRATAGDIKRMCATAAPAHATLGATAGLSQPSSPVAALVASVPDGPFSLSDADACVFCGCAFVRARGTFEPLPLVQFAADPSVPLADAIQMLEAPPPRRSNSGKGSGLASCAVSSRSGGSTTATTVGGADVLRLDSPENSAESSMAGVATVDPFVQLLSNANATEAERRDGAHGGKAEVCYAPVPLAAAALRSLPPSEVFLVWPAMAPAAASRVSPLQPPRMYKNLLPEMQIKQCRVCHRLSAAGDDHDAELEGCEGCHADVAI